VGVGGLDVTKPNQVPNPAPKHKKKGRPGTGRSRTFVGSETLSPSRLLQLASSLRREAAALEMLALELSPTPEAESSVNGTGAH